MSNTIYSPKGKRKLSSFLGRELLYDYLTDQLDETRKRSVEEYLETQREGQADLQKIKLGMVYASSLRQTEVSQEFLRRIQLEQNYSETVYSKIRYHDWPDGIKFGLKIVGVTAAVVLIGIVTPWSYLSKISFNFSGPVVLTEVARTEKVDPQNSETVAAAPTELPAYIDEGGPSPTIKNKPAEPPAKTPVKAVATTTTLAVIASSPKPTTTVKEKATTGVLYRGTVSITNVSAITPKLVQRLEELGGRKAGEVPLGWKKGTGSYFHFTVPEGRLDKVEALFNEYGKLRLSKEKHERIMPEGILRIIVDVEEEKKPK